jgi:hypothetical protein
MTQSRGPSVRPAHARDTDATAFTLILSELVSRIPGAHSAALVDGDGESVDYTGRAAPFDVKVAAAHFRIVIDETRALAPFQALSTLVVRGSAKSFVARVLPDGYAIVVLLGRRAGFSALRALDVCERSLVAEAGLTPRAVPPWTVVTVDCDVRKRPTRVASPGSVGYDVEVLGSVLGLPHNERAFRVRLETGAEVMLVRERGGTWYADEPIDFTRSRGTVPVPAAAGSFGLQRGEPRRYRPERR